MSPFKKNPPFFQRKNKNRRDAQEHQQEVMNNWNNSNYNNLPLRRDSNDQFLRGNPSRQMQHPR